MMAKKKRFKTPRRGTGTRKYVMKGGPLNGVALWLSCPGTLSFTMNGMTGRYDGNNQWRSN